ncbi:MAG: hypothetical protein R6X02_23550 [Enhygromyxa sp.]
MRIWITVSLLLTGCVLVQLDDPPESRPETEDPGDEPEEPDEDSVIFVPLPDIPPHPDACDPLHPECEAGSKCTLVRGLDVEWNGRCVPLADETVAVGERCVAFEEPGHDNCEAGSICWDFMAGEGTCLSFCEGFGNGPDCGEGYVCNRNKSFDAGLCTPVCDPLSTSDCPETCACYWMNDNFFCLPWTSNFATGEPCGFINDCAPLNLCVSAELLPACEGGSCCAAYCDLDEGACDPGTSCVAFFEEGSAPPGYEHVGVCVSPDA